MKKLVATLTLIVLAFFAVACNLTVEVSAKVVQKEEKVFVIEVGHTTEGATLMDVLSALRDRNEVDYTLSGEYIRSINGVANKADYSGYWYIYTSDEENSNKEWGIYEYNGVELGSSKYMADNLKVKLGEIYAFVYQEY